MENSKGYSLRKRKHLPGDNYEANRSSHVKIKPGGSNKLACFSELPEVVMQNIYRCLPSEDLINIKEVCDNWKEFTNRTSVWRHAPVKLYDSNLKELSNIPYIHSVIGDIYDTETFVNTAINNYQDLRRLGIIFHPYISAGQVAKLITKFSNLESIALDFSAPDILKTLSVLQDCPKLKEIIFYGFVSFNSWIPFFNMLVKIKSLDTLDLSLISTHANLSDILYLLELKMKQLVSLEVFFSDTLSEDITILSAIISKIICDSNRLETLNFSLAGPELHDVILNFAQIRNLKHLNLQLLSGEQENLLAQLTFPASLEYVEILFSGVPYRCRVLEQIIMSCPNLRCLDLSHLMDSDINEQLENINILQNLHAIILETCNNLSAQGLHHISKCSKLRLLALSHLSLNNSKFDCLKSLKYLQVIGFVNCNLKPVRLVETVLHLERLTHLRLNGCYRWKRNKRVKYSSLYLNRIFKKCREKNPVLTITW